MRFGTDPAGQPGPAADVSLYNGSATDMSNGYYDWALECTFGRGPKCNYLATLRVGLDARMHDRVRFRFPGCTAEAVVPIVMRGARPSPAYGPELIPAELIG